MDYSLIIPVYNEEKALPILVEELEKINQNVEIIFINDGSSDETGQILNKHIDKFKIIENQTNLGKGASLQKGILAANKKNIFLIDGDLEIATGSIPILIKHFESSKCDAILGIRWRRFELQPLGINRLGNFLINEVFNFIYKTKFSDVLCCAKIINTNLIRNYNINSADFEIECEIMRFLALNQISYKEHKVKYIRRKVSEGKKLKYSDSWSILKTIIFYKE